MFRGKNPGKVYLIAEANEDGWERKNLQTVIYLNALLRDVKDIDAYLQLFLVKPDRDEDEKDKKEKDKEEEKDDVDVAGEGFPKEVDPNFLKKLVRSVPQFDDAKNQTCHAAAMHAYLKMTGKQLDQVDQSVVHLGLNIGHWEGGRPGRTPAKRQRGFVRELRRRAQRGAEGHKKCHLGAVARGCCHDLFAQH
jgi:hypothetical protein